MLSSVVVLAEDNTWATGGLDAEVERSAAGPE